jgi:hypothetical protein
MRKQTDVVFFNKVNLVPNDQKGPVHLKIMLHYWGKQRAYWGKCPSSYIVKKCSVNQIFIRINES